MREAACVTPPGELLSRRYGRMNVAHPYHAFGLEILSEIEISHWLAGAAPWDVSIQWGTVPAELPDATCLHGVCWARADACLLNYPGMGRLLIASGDRMTVALDVGGDLSVIGTLISVTGMAAVLYQRGQICLHASAVAKDGKAILFMGLSGAGKSTLASALLQRGYDFISDDISVVQPGTGGAFEVVRSYPLLRLSRDAYRELDLSCDLRSIDPLDEKHWLQPKVEGAPRRAVVTRICLLETGPVLVPSSKPIRGIERVQTIQKNMFRPLLAKVIGDQERLLEMSVGLGRQLDLRRITRPRSGFHVESLCALATE